MVQHRSFIPAVFASVFAACAAWFFWSTPVHAQAAEIAKSLIEEAKNLKESGKIAEACPLLDRSYELDAKDGVLFARADCRDKENKIAVALNLYEAYLRACSRMTGVTKENHAERVDIAEKRIAELRPRVPMIKFVWKNAPPPETKVTIDNIEYRASTLEGRLPLEPGTHVVVVSLPGEPERRRTVVLTEGGSTVIDLSPLPLSARKPEPIDMDKLMGSIPDAPATPKPRLVPGRKVERLQIGGIAGVGLGIAGIVTASITGSMAKAEKSVVDAHCNDAHRCDIFGIEAAERARSLGNDSTAMFIAGGVMATVGATLLVVTYRNPSAPVTASFRLNATPNATHLGIEGSF